METLKTAEPLQNPAKGFCPFASFIRSLYILLHLFQITFPGIFCQFWCSTHVASIFSIMLDQDFVSLVTEICGLMGPFIHSTFNHILIFTLRSNFSSFLSYFSQIQKLLHIEIDITRTSGAKMVTRALNLRQARDQHDEGSQMSSCCLLHASSLLGLSSTLKIEATDSCEMLADFHQTI
jgi:hypothetical protein